MMGSQEVIKRLLWGWLVMLSLTCTAQANTLSKFRVADSDGSAQITLSTSTPPSYKITSLLKQNLVVLHLSGTAALPHYALPRFTGPLIQDIRISEIVPSDVAEPNSRVADEPPDGVSEERNSGVKVEVLLKASDVTVSHKLLNKPAGLLLLIRARKGSTKAGDTVESQRQAKDPRDHDPAMAETQRNLRDAEPPSSGFEPAPPKAVVKATDSPSRGELVNRPVPPLAPPEEDPKRRLKQDNAVQPEPPVMSSLPASEAMTEIKESASSAEALALLDLYFHRPTVFAATPSLLWSVATAYADLGLYEEAQVLYTRISEQADNSLLQAAALLKRGNIALRQREWGIAETLLRQLVSTCQHGPFLAEAYEALGDVLMEQGKITEAVDLYAVALTYAPEAQKPPPLLYKLGRAHGKAGHWPQAVEALRKATEHGQAPPSGATGLAGVPSAMSLAILQQLGDSLYKSQQYQDAVVAYRGLLERSPSSQQTQWALYHLAHSYEKLGNPHEALQAYQELARQDDPFWSEMGHQALATLRWHAR
jgi:tetratricopeptide (TPR) repeat protein